LIQFLLKINSILKHPVAWLFSGVQGGSTTKTNRLELLFSVV